MKFKDIQLIAENNTTIVGLVVEAFDFGVRVDYNEIIIFVPKSYIGLLDVDLSLLIGKSLPLKIVEVDAKKSYAIGSVRAVIREKCTSFPIIDQLEIGTIYSGVVESICKYGVFVEVHGIIGLIHISNLGLKNITNTIDAVMLGDIIEVVVLDINYENGQVSLAKSSPPITESNNLAVPEISSISNHLDSTCNNVSEETIDSLLNQLHNLTGLESVKSEVNSIINLAKLQKIRQQRGMPELPMSLHLVFSGNPGTGKTTVARLLAKIYYKLGVLTTGQLIEVDRSKLVGGYVGQTAIKTQEVIQQAIGGILFIDEAYTLSRTESPSDYGQEAIDTILKAMEDNRNNLIVIVAGYPDLMEQFLNSNPGLRARFNKYIYFDDYTPNELIEIFERMCKTTGFVLTPSALEWISQYFEEQYIQRDKNFANGREVRNCFEKAVINQANRLAILQNWSEKDITTMTLEDVIGFKN